MPACVSYQQVLLLFTLTVLLSLEILVVSVPQLILVKLMCSVQ